MAARSSWRIRISVDGHQIAERRLREGDAVVVGRDERADVQVRENSVSRRHCECRASVQGVELRDLGSANGIWVDDRRHGRITLTDGQVARIGLAELEIENLGGSGGGLKVALERPGMAAPTSSIEDTTRQRTAIDPSSQAYQSLAKDRLALLIEAGKSLSSSADPDEVLRSVLDLLPQIFPVKRAVIALQDEQGDLRARSAWPPSEFAQLSEVCSQNIIRNVLATGEARIISDASAETELGLAMSVMVANIKAAICAPLISRTHTIGAVYADFPGRAGLYSQEDLDFFGAFASLAAVAIESATMQRALRERERLDRDLEIAAEIQRGLLPVDVPHDSGFDVAWEYWPSQEVGGDFYDCIPLKDGRTMITLGDVSGKSVGAAMFMSRLVSTVRAVVESEPRPSRVLARVNDLLISTSNRVVFSTACCLVLCPRTKRLVLSSAGHHPTLLIAPGKTEIERLHPRGLPLGIQAGSEFMDLERTLEPGTLIFLYTDGVHESRNGEGEHFGLERLDRLLLEGRDASCDELCARVLEAVTEFRGRSEYRQDDVAMLALRV